MAPQLDGAVPYQKVKRVSHGFRNFTNYWMRLLLHCGIRWQTHRTARLRGRSPHSMATWPASDRPRGARSGLVRHVPQQDCLVVAARCQRLPIRGERH
jgi:hypothetical protein